MRELITVEVAKAIGDFFLQWGTPGIIVIFLYEERRRLIRKIEVMQSKLDESYEARMKVNQEAFEVVKKNESTVIQLQSFVAGFIGNRKGERDV